MDARLSPTTVSTPFGPRRAAFVTVDAAAARAAGLSDAEVTSLEQLDALYRRLVAVMFNFVPTSGHPGGSISAGRLAQALVFGPMDYDISQPWRDDADVLSYAAGHKALGLYALWALRDEVVRLGVSALLPDDPHRRLRFEDLLGFRKNPLTRTHQFGHVAAKALDGHPTPATPFVRLATGASGVGLASSVGLALGLADYYGAQAPCVHVIEGEAGLTPGRVSEALAAAGSASLGNLVLHVDWNQSSIDSDHVCRAGGQPGDYVQWDPAELCYLHDWNVVLVPDGHDVRQIAAGQRQAIAFDNHQPTAIVYRTTKGWRYGIEGCRSHGAGHAFCSPPYLDAVNRSVGDARWKLRCWADPPCCDGGENANVVERCYLQSLQLLRAELRETPGLVSTLARHVIEARERLDQRRRSPRPAAPDLRPLQAAAERAARAEAGTLIAAPGSRTTLREALASLLAHLGDATGGGLLLASADLLGSTSLRLAGAGFAPGFWNALSNPRSRLLATGGICEDAMCGILSGIAMAGHHVGVGSSYAAFLAPLGHIAARLHAIGRQAQRERSGEVGQPLILVCAHAGIETGEDGPTHADPQCLQLLQENFPKGALVTLTPWEPQEVPVLVAAALRHDPAVIAVFVTRPSNEVLDRHALGLAPAAEAASGLYLLRRAAGPGRSAVILQGSEVAGAFVQHTLPRLLDADIDVDVYYVSSAELFGLLAREAQSRILPERVRSTAMGITGFTLPTLLPWISSQRGRLASLHPFKAGGFLGSGRADQVLLQAGLDGDNQFRQIASFVRGEVHEQ